MTCGRDLNQLLFVFVLSFYYLYVIFWVIMVVLNVKMKKNKNKKTKNQKQHRDVLICFVFRMPMLDLLIHVTAANKISPAAHLLQVTDEEGRLLPHKPSTPIGMTAPTT